MTSAIAASSSVGEPEAVLAHDLLQVVEAAFQVLEPARGALQAIGRAHVEHQEPVDVLDERLAVEIRGEQIGVARLHAAVAADVEVPALLRRDDAHVLALRLGAFARAAGDGELDLVRRTQTLVAILQLDGEAHAVLHAVAAPGAAHTRLHGAQRLAVGVTGLEAGVGQLTPDRGQLVHLRAEEIDALAAGDLRVQAVFLGHLRDDQQLVGRDLAAGDARHHRIAAVLLQVREVVVVRVLQDGLVLLQHELVVLRGEDRADGGLADVAAEPLPCLPTSSPNVLICPTFTRWNSSWREYGSARRCGC